MSPIHAAAPPTTNTATTTEETPMSTTLKLDKDTAYDPGNTMTLTVTSAAGDRAQYEDVPGRVTVDPDADGPIQPVTLDYVAKRQSTTLAPLAVTDPQRTWVKVSDDGTTAVYTSKA